MCKPKMRLHLLILVEEKSFSLSFSGSVIIRSSLNRLKMVLLTHQLMPNFSLIQLNDWKHAISKQKRLAAMVTCAYLSTK